MKAHKPVTERIRQYLLRNPHASNDEIAEKLYCALSSVSNVRKELIRAGLVEPSHRHRRSAVPNKGSGTSALIQRIMNKDVEDEERPGLRELNFLLKKEMPQGDVDDVTPEEYKKVLSRIIRRPDISAQVIVAAGNAKLKVDEYLADKKDLGPGSPITEEDAIVRLSLLMQACGRTITLKALKRAFHLSISEGVTNESIAPNEQTSPPSGIEETPVKTGHEDSQEAIETPLREE